jgi:hypothetical protein
MDGFCFGVCNMDPFEFASPFEVEGKKFNHPAGDIEAFVGWWCAEHTIQVRKNNRDSTGKWFHLYFDKYKGLDWVYFGGMTFLEDINRTQITYVWSEDTYSPNATDREKKLRDREIQDDFRLLKELSSAVLERFRQFVSVEPKTNQIIKPEYLTLLEQKHFDAAFWDLELIKLWNEGHDDRYIATRVGVSVDRVENRKSELRRLFGKDGEKILPKLKERNRRIMESRGTA